MTEIFICEKILATSASSGKKLLPNYTLTVTHFYMVGEAGYSQQWRTLDIKTYHNIVLWAQKTQDEDIKTYHNIVLWTQKTQDEDIQTYHNIVLWAHKTQDEDIKPHHNIVLWAHKT
jgi:hypothetical protein